VAPGLQPAVQLAVVQQQDTAPVRGEDERAARQMAVGDPAIERVRVPGHEGEDGREVRGFVGPFRLMPAQPVQQPRRPRSAVDQFARANGWRRSSPMAAAASTGRE
jgi:hypothetical protein